jgi:hypothetical protein
MAFVWIDHFEKRVISRAPILTCQEDTNCTMTESVRVSLLEG